ncbi:MAG TPA: carbohydrate-binding protein [Ktedonobacteraceae bacterium]|nr:carbohydrate-binding protein [Ktedonobacteraceae bacterium]
MKDGPLKFFDVPSTGDWNTVGKLTTTVHLNAGDNTITFFNPDGPAPDIDRIVVATQSGTIPTAAHIDMSTSYEAAAPGNTLSGGAKVWDCSQCSGGKRVRYIDKGGALQFNKVSAKRAGQYTLWIYYIDVEGLKTSRALYISVNGGSAIAYKTLGTGTWSGLRTLKVTVSLNAGNNTIKFSNPLGSAPNLDRIVVSS